MSLNLPQKVWMYAEKLYIHAHDADKFIALLKKHGVEYENEAYSELSTHPNIYVFMSDENYKFADFMQYVPTYKYLTILEDIVFDTEVIKTRDDGWNYYGEFISSWYPSLIELIELAGAKVNKLKKKLEFSDVDIPSDIEDLLPYAFNDPFLDSEV